MTETREFTAPTLDAARAAATEWLTGGALVRVAVTHGPAGVTITATRTQEDDE